MRYARGSYRLLVRLNPGPVQRAILAYGQRLFAAGRELTEGGGHCLPPRVVPGDLPNPAVGKGGGTRRRRRDVGGSGTRAGTGKGLTPIGRSVPCNWIGFGATTKRYAHATTVYTGCPCQVQPRAGKIAHGDRAKTIGRARRVVSGVTSDFAARRLEIVDGRECFGEPVSLATTEKKPIPRIFFFVQDLRNHVLPNDWQ